MYSTAQAERPLAGLLCRPSELPPERSECFVFPSLSRGGFWMKDTPIPLDIAYLDASGTVMEINTVSPTT
jgi:uncharacterized membrane protein (UPF0127 family)